MIITRTPLRVSLVGGGTDLPAFYRRYGGAVVSLAIDKYVYITLNPKFDGAIRLSYSKTENVKRPESLQHDLVRNTLKFFNIAGVEITSVADIPSQGSGLGSSGAFLVGLLLAITERRQTPWCPMILAETAFTIESKMSHHPAGKQDQYAAAYGGLHFFEFQRDNVRVEPFSLLDEELSYIMQRMMLFWTGGTRKSSTILNEQTLNLTTNQKYRNYAKKMRDLAQQMRDSICAGELDSIGESLHENWELKKKMATGISNPYIDSLYEKARQAGATGGKLCGAGGSGFLLFYVPPERQENVQSALGLRQIPIRLEEKGSTVIYNGGLR